MNDLTERQQVILKLGQNRRLAHRTFFGHRHPNDTPDFHYEIMDLWGSSIPQVAIEAFRGAAKSTLAEEAITLGSCYREFHNALILGETYHRAVERLTAIKHELETNPYIEDLFGSLVGPVWTEGKIVLTNGIIIQAFGRGQSLRGSKHLDHRPDLAFGDDIEDEESTKDEEAIRKTMRWLMAVVKPALAPGAKIRINGTRLHPQAVIVQLAAQPDWTARQYPIEHFDSESGERVATWADRRPLDWIDAERTSYARLGMSTEFNQEYMCQAEDAASKPFTADLWRVEPTVKTWQAVYSMHDPARTTNKTSASTGACQWSWVNNRLLVWDAYAGFWKPDEIVADIFRVDELYRPIVLGIERDGLEEFILQPLRQEQIRRGYSVPIRAMRAPKGKLDFIRGLQPFFKAHEVIFAKDMPEAKAQFLSFPSGRIDVPNALAYAFMLRPGQAIYDGFSVQNIAGDLSAVARVPLWVALNATAACTTGVLMQMVEGSLHVLADWVREGDPGAVLASIVADAGLECERPARYVAGPSHFTNFDTIGMRPAARKIPVELRRGGGVLEGREELRGLFKQAHRGIPRFRVAEAARWTLNALSGGYARATDKSGVLSEFAVEGPYKVLMEGVEAFAAMLRTGARLDEDAQINYAYTDKGVRYITSLPR